MDIEPKENTISAAHDTLSHQRLITIFWLIAIVLGAIAAWDARYIMDPDGISYLDMGDAYFRGDWEMAINAYWSPLYSWLLGLALYILKPSPFWEYPVVHLVNLVIYLCSLGCFQFFMNEFIRYHRSQKGRFSEYEGVTLPEWAWLVIGYTLFIWSSLKLITLSVVTPDMCVSAFVYLASGLLLRIQRGAGKWAQDSCPCFRQDANAFYTHFARRQGDGRNVAL